MGGVCHKSQEITSNLRLVSSAKIVRINHYVKSDKTQKKSRSLFNSYRT